ncbi:MAG TPA: ABC transporter ATP-binding protein [Steroidobacteraceae bacterium]|jgi:peptide/nickel transport system ATP-binding protein
MIEPILSVRDLVVEFDTLAGTVHAVDGVSFDLYPGESLGVVGESGSGKSVTAMSILGLVSQSSGRIVNGEILYRGVDTRTMSPAELRALRGRDIAMVFQDPMSSLNPVVKVGNQLVEAIRVKDSSISRLRARHRAIELLELVGVPDPESRAAQYPHQYSGGMRQRAMIAMAIANGPSILIADEPTTALDVTIQAQVLDVLELAQRETNSATVLITHDLGIVAEFAQRVVVMYAGRIIEEGPATKIFANPTHPYTVGLLASLPRLTTSLDRLLTIPGSPPSAIDKPSGCAFHPRCRLQNGRSICVTSIPELTGNEGEQSACHFADEVPAYRKAVDIELLAARPSEPRTGISNNGGDVRDRPRAAGGQAVLLSSAPEVLRVENLKTYFPIKSSVLGRQVGAVKAVDGVDLVLHKGETLGLVGESGCGKSTTGKSIMRLIDVTDGRIEFKNRDITHLKRSQLREVRRDMQMVFQDPYASLDPRMSVREIIAEPLQIHQEYRGARGRARVNELLELVGLRPEHATRYAHEFSGGQRQRIGIARAIALNPDLLILDEPVSSLDVSIQAQVINLLMDLQRELGLAYLFIAHDLAVVRQISHRVAVMYLGRVVETGQKENVYTNAAHPYSQALLSAVPVPDPALRGHSERIVLTGDVPNPASPPSGCHFRTRCPRVQEICHTVDPSLEAYGAPGHESACLFPGQDAPLVAATMTH